MIRETRPASAALHSGQGVHVNASCFGHEVTFEGQLADFSARYLAITLDIEARTFLSAPPTGTPVSVSVTGNGCVYRFQTVFRGSSKLPVMSWFVDRPSIVLRVQMRRFARVPIVLPLKVQLPDKAGILQPEESAMLVDISGGGLCFASVEAVPVEARIAVDIPELPIYGMLKSEAFVRRCTEAAREKTSQRVYHVGASLEESLTKAQQEMLIRAVFEIQNGGAHREYVRGMDYEGGRHPGMVGGCFSAGSLGRPQMPFSCASGKPAPNVAVAH